MMKNLLLFWLLTGCALATPADLDKADVLVPLP